MKRILSVLVTAAVLVTLLASCTQSQPAETPGTADVTAQADVTGSQTAPQPADTTARKEAQSQSEDVTTAKPVANKADITAKFTDPAFLSYVRELVGKDEGESVSASDVANIESVECPNKSISSLNGIAYFTALEYLDCGNNRIKTLNLSKNTALTDLVCYSNLLTKLDLSRNTALTVLDCGDNRLKKLDVSKNTALTELICDDGVTVTGYGRDAAQETQATQATQATPAGTVPGNTDITAKFTDPNFLSRVRELVKKTNGEPILANDVAGIQEVNFDGGNVYVPSEDFFETNDFSSHGSFRSYPEISSLNGIEYFTALTQLTCSDNKLTTLDVSKNTALTVLGCSNNQLTALDVSKNTALTVLVCDVNKLTNLDVSKNTALARLGCYKNQLTTLDLSKNPMLTDLTCSDNKLTELDVSKNTALVTLSCKDNNLTELDLSKNLALGTSDSGYGSKYAVRCDEGVVVTGYDGETNLG
ncbi:hypothetical protein FACS1894133_2960 [Clostridia bacterium]|nr:hypothetical protein FACS1894133_2960 [Clostridia bacterium]